MKDHANVKMHGGAAKELTCAAGHTMMSEWLTADLKGVMGSVTYHLLDGRLYRADGPDAVEEIDVRLERNTLLLTKRTVERAPFVNHTGLVHVYTRCMSCRPVVYAVRSAAAGHAMLEARIPWVEYAMKFVDGRLLEQKAVKLEARQDVVRELRETGVQVLDDDSHLAKSFCEELSTKDRDLELLIRGRY